MRGEEDWKSKVILNCRASLKPTCLQNSFIFKNSILPLQDTLGQVKAVLSIGSAVRSAGTVLSTRHSPIRSGVWWVQALTYNVVSTLGDVKAKCLLLLFPSWVCVYVCAHAHDLFFHLILWEGLNQPQFPGLASLCISQLVLGTPYLHFSKQELQAGSHIHPGSLGPVL